MEKWEYLVSRFTRPDSLLKELNKLGEQGWEAVAIMAEGHILLKRQKSDPQVATEPRQVLPQEVVRLSPKIPDAQSQFLAGCSRD